MSALLIAGLVGLFAVGLVCLLFIVAAVAVAGLKILNVAHDGSSWLAGKLVRSRTHLR